VIVLDSSYALALVMPDEQRPASMQAVIEDDLVAPFIWPLEIANALRTNLRRGRLSPERIEPLFQRIAGLRVDVVGLPHGQPQPYFDAAQAHDLTPYDATYISAAVRFSAALATRDAALATVAERLGIPIYR
jgi:predicted nucleic acid-binding protein